MSHTGRTEDSIISQHAIRHYSKPELKSTAALNGGRLQGILGEIAPDDINSGKANTERERINLMIWV